MKYSDMVIDFNDIYGRFIPGIVLLGDFYFLLRYLKSPALTTFLAFLDSALTTSNLSIISETLFLLFIIITAIIIGEIPLFLIFKLKPKFLNTSLYDMGSEFRFIKQEKFLKVLEKDINSEYRNDKKSFDSIRLFMKYYLLKNFPEAYTQAMRLEAKINLYGGLVIPCLLAVVISCLYAEWVIAGIFAISTFVFANEFRGALVGEAELTLMSYYQHRLATERDESKRK